MFRIFWGGGRKGRDSQENNEPAYKKRNEGEDGISHSSCDTLYETKRKCSDDNTYLFADVVEAEVGRVIFCLR